MYIFYIIIPNILLNINYLLNINKNKLLSHNSSITFSDFPTNIIIFHRFPSENTIDI